MQPTVDIPSLMRSLDHWEYAEWVAMAFVTIGVAGESVHSFTSWFKRFPWWVNKGNRAAGLVLIVALSFEFLFTMMGNAKSDHIDQVLSAQSANAVLKAAMLGTTVDSLQTFVQQKEKVANQQMDLFQKLASAQ